MYRKLVQPGFAPGRMRALEADVRRRAKLLVDEIEAGRTVDFVETVAVPFPLYIISALLGMPDEDWHRFFEWSEAVIPGATDWSEEKRAALGQAPPNDPEVRRSGEEQLFRRIDVLEIVLRAEPMELVGVSIGS